MEVLFKIFSFQDVADSLSSIKAKLERADVDGGPDIGGAIAQINRMIVSFEDKTVKVDSTGPIWSRNC